MGSIHTTKADPSTTPSPPTATTTPTTTTITVGVLALQGAFNEHILLLRQAAQILGHHHHNHHHQHNSRAYQWEFLAVRTVPELDRCNALIIPGGESTAISLAAQRGNLLEPLRDFVKTQRNPTWGTCAGLILLAEAAQRTKKGGQELIGGLDVRVRRNHFGRQRESFEVELELGFLNRRGCGRCWAGGVDVGDGGEEGGGDGEGERKFKAIFIRAPVVEKLLLSSVGRGSGTSIGNRGGPPQEEVKEALHTDDFVTAPSRNQPAAKVDEKSKNTPPQPPSPVEVLATLPGKRAVSADAAGEGVGEGEGEGEIVAVRQGNVFGTSFHPELAGDSRIHVWWLEQVATAVESGLGCRP